MQTAKTNQDQAEDDVMQNVTRRKLLSLLCVVPVTPIAGLLAGTTGAAKSGDSARARLQMPDNDVGDGTRSSLRLRRLQGPDVVDDRIDIGIAEH